MGEVFSVGSHDSVIWFLGKVLEGMEDGDKLLIEKIGTRYVVSGYELEPSIARREILRVAEVG